MKFLSLALTFVMMLTLTSCRFLPADKTPAFETQTEVDADKLMKEHPVYADLSTSKGIEVYVWQMAENSYHCGLLSGTNRAKSDEEIMGLIPDSLDIDEAKAILNKLGLSQDDITVIPTSMPYSSYLYEVDDEYCERVKALFA